MQTHSPFSLAFEQSERELGERIGYPALVYEDAPLIAEPNVQLEAMKALIELLDLGEWTWSEADDCGLFTIHLRESHYEELIDLIPAE